MPDAKLLSSPYLTWGVLSIACALFVLSRVRGISLSRPLSIEKPRGPVGFMANQLHTSGQLTGFNGHGFNGHGFNGHGFNGHGFSCYGFNGHGFNGHGFNGHGFNGRGFNGHGFNSHGFNGHGLNGQGFNGHGVQCSQGSHPASSRGFPIVGRKAQSDRAGSLFAAIHRRGGGGFNRER